MSEAKGNVSFLLGSGFSIPEGLCSVWEINQKIVNTKADDFYLSQDRKARYYIPDDDYRDPNEQFTRNDRILFEDLINGYVTLVLANDKNKFNYEDFFEFTNNLYDNIGNAAIIKQICDKYRAKLKIKDEFNNNDLNLAARFNNIYEQLVADLLDVPSYWEEVTTNNHTPYDSFIDFVSTLLESKEVNIHTLNHDLFFDYLGRWHNKLSQHYCDGYTEKDSRIYGYTANQSPIHKGLVLYKRYKVRLRYFNDSFDNNLRLFKLHGSIDTFKLHKQDRDIIRMKSDIGVDDFNIEEFDNQTQKYVDSRPYINKEPDFLTGRAFKTNSYEESYYKVLFAHFEENLKKSERLIVIGYGFKDDGINEYLEKHYLSKGGKVIVIDKFKPAADIITKYPKQFEFHLEGVTGYSRDEFISMLGS